MLNNTMKIRTKPNKKEKKLNQKINRLKKIKKSSTHLKKEVKIEK